MSDHHDHSHDPHAPIEEAGGPTTEHEILEIALRELLIEKGVFTPADLNSQIEDDASRTPAQGARFVARYWSDPGFRERALANGKKAAAEIGINVNVAPDLAIVENTPDLHHVIVCTLCSCYPTAILGSPPAWYKSKAYRARLVKNPREVLAEFGTTLPDNAELRVVDSTAEIRYLVVPARPEGTEHLNEEQLAELVTRDSMIGVTQARKHTDPA